MQDMYWCVRYLEINICRESDKYRYNALMKAIEPNLVKARDIVRSFGSNSLTDSNHHTMPRPTITSHTTAYKPRWPFARVGRTQCVGHCGQWCKASSISPSCTGLFVKANSWNTTTVLASLPSDNNPSKVCAKQNKYRVATKTKQAHGDS